MFSRYAFSWRAFSKATYRILWKADDIPESSKQIIFFKFYTLLWFLNVCLYVETLIECRRNSIVSPWYILSFCLNFEKIIWNFRLNIFSKTSRLVVGKKNVSFLKLRLILFVIVLLTLFFMLIFHTLHITQWKKQTKLAQTKTINS